MKGNEIEMKDGAVVFDIQKFSVHDGPGIRTIVFFKGCPLRCKWCANPESHEFAEDLLYYPDKCIGCGKCVEICGENCISVSEDGIILFDRNLCTDCCKCTEVCYAEARRKSGEFMSLDEIKGEVDKDLVFYRNSGGGITFSGGEAMCFPEAVRELAQYYKDEQKISVAIETCGCVPWENYEMVLPFLDLVMYDIKLIDDERHIEFTGGSNVRILENIKQIYKKVKTVVRIPIVPGINDSKEDIKDFGDFVSGMRDGIDTIHILPYHNLGINKYHALGRRYELEHIKAPDDSKMEKIKKQLETYGFNVIIGG